MADTALQALLAWTSPAYPVGAYTYSHGLETAVDRSAVRDVDSLSDYALSVISHGGGWIDAVLFAHCWRAAGSPEAFDELAELAAAFRGTRETALESHQQGRSFLQVTRRAWPHSALDAFATRWADRPVAHCTVLALACAVHGVMLADGLAGMLHATAANLVSAGVRLVPLGQTDGQIATARLSAQIPAIVDRALACPIDDLGSAAPLIEVASCQHETLYTRLFRS